MSLNPLGIGEGFELHLFLFINKNNQLKTYFDKQNSTKKLVIFWPIFVFIQFKANIIATTFIK